MREPDPIQVRVRPTEDVILRVWQKLLKNPNIQATDNFFELGGDSLLALRSIAGVRELTGVQIGLRTLFEEPTARTLALKLQSSTKPNAKSIDKPTDRPVFFMFPGVGGDEIRLHNFCKNCKIFIDINIVVYPSLKEIIQQDFVMGDMVSSIVQTIQETAPTGPISLIGYSIGGSVAHAVAIRLIEIGREISFIILLDSIAYGKIQNLEKPSRTKIVNKNARNYAGYRRFTKYITRKLRFVKYIVSNDTANIARTVASIIAKPRLRPFIRFIKPIIDYPSSNEFKFHLHRRLSMIFLSKIIRSHTISKVIGQETPTILFRSEVTRTIDAHEEMWRSICANLHVHHTAGDHQTLMNEANAKVIISEIVAEISAVGETRNS